MSLKVIVSVYLEKLRANLCTNWICIYARKVFSASRQIVFTDSLLLFFLYEILNKFTYICHHVCFVHWLLEIWITFLFTAVKFSQQYEIKRVSIRSSARAFRIDCKPTLESVPKCLSTVLCEPVYKDEDDDDWEIVNSTDSPWLDRGDDSRIQVHIQITHLLVFV